MATVNSYKDKYIGVDGRLSVMEILQRVGTTEYREGAIKEYEAVDIAEVKIDGNRFRNYGAYSFIWEKTFVKSPERSASGSLGNLNSYATFLTPHLILDFSVMSIDDYRKIMLLHYGANEFTVECYDPIYNQKIKVKMYFGTEEMAKLYTIAQNRLLPDGQWEEWVDLVGVTEYKVELIGTNNDLDLVSVKYEYSIKDENGNPIYVAPNGSPMPPQYEEDIYLGEEIVVGGNSTFKDTPPSNDFVFDHWLGSDGLVYSDGLIKTIIAPITFYAVWVESKTKTLTFNYGLSDVQTEVDSATGVVTEVLSRQVQEGKSIGTLPPITAEPSVKGSDGKLYYPYYNGGWYKHPIKPKNEEEARLLQVKSNELYWSERDTTIYALYDKRLFSVTYHTNDPNTSLPSYNAKYQDEVYHPTLSRNGYSFQGWYVDPQKTKAFSGAMPPYDLTLYAKWSEK